MLRAKAELLQYDYVYYLDVDSWFVADVGEEILSELVGTIHPGFCGAPRSNLPYCKNINSTAYIYPYEGKRHYCGAFQGGRADRYIEAMEAMKAAIDTDNRYGIIADWHDESQWNRYLASNPPTLSLSHDYCSPINWGIKSAKIVNPVTGPFCGCTGGRG
jgi:histo-blood group ABO system transferase